jgi:hypothetical protein
VHLEHLLQALDLALRLGEVGLEALFSSGEVALSIIFGSDFAIWLSA